MRASSVNRVLGIIVAGLSVVHLQLSKTEAVSCFAGGKLTLQYLNTTTKGGSPVTCQDGTKTGYFIDFPPSCNVPTDAFDKGAYLDIIPPPAVTSPCYPTARKFILWLGDGDLCSGSACDDRCDLRTTNPNGVCYNVTVEFDEQQVTDNVVLCYAARFMCSSTDWKRAKKITPDTILCRDDPFFATYVRVYIPMCTLDWFLGTKNDANSTSPRFRGANVLVGLVEELVLRFQLDQADTIILGGTLGSAVGALNNVKRLRGMLPNVTNWLIVADSAFVFDVEAFAPNSTDPDLVFGMSHVLKNRSSDWISSAIVDANCSSHLPANDKYRCLMTSFVAPNFLADEKVMFLQSQYDLLVLSQTGVLDTTKQNLFADVPSYAIALGSYIESWGGSIRNTINDCAAQVTAKGGLHTYYSTSCPQSGYIVPTAIHQIQPTLRDVGSAGSLLFQRTSYVWQNVTVGNLNMKDAVVFWMASNGTKFPRSATESSADFPYGVRSDYCGSFLCNESCQSQVFPYALKPIWPSCMRMMVLVYCGIMVFLMWFSFAISYVSVRRFRRITRAFWHIKLGIQAQSGGAKIPSLRRPKTSSLNPEGYINPTYDHKSVNLPSPSDAKAQMADDYSNAQEALLKEAAESEYRKVHLMLRDVSYWSPPLHKRGAKYQILRNINLALTPGSMHALMGPSGSGKSTLLDVTALIRDSGEISGTHYINGVESHKSEALFLRDWLRNNVSYVKQTDVLFPMLTVREHLTHCAWLMLPEYMSSERKLLRVMQVIKLLELDRCADTICGDGGIAIEGGISGGQRRRVSVAAQLLRLPAAMLLDEPTSGLDSTSALTLVRALSTLAHRGGVNIVMTIHQPRQEIFELFDMLTILVSGRIVYSGPPKQSGAHFGIPPKEKNVSNEILDLLSKVSLDKCAEFRMKYETGPLGQAMLEGMNRETTVFTPEMAADLQAVLLENALGEGRWSWTTPNSAPTQMWVLLSRTMKRGGMNVLMTSFLAAIGGVIVGLCFHGIGTFTSKTAMCYLGINTLTFLQATFLGNRYIGEKTMYDHEQNSGAATAWQAFLASQFVRDALTSGLEGLSFGIPFYFIGGMNPDWNRFGIFLVIIIMVALVCISQNVLVEIYSDDPRVAALINVGLVGLGALFNGFIIRISDLPVYFTWVPYLMVTYWGFVAVLINDFAGYYFNSASQAYTKLENMTRTGDAIVEALSYGDRDVNVALFSITIMIVCMRGLSCLIFYRQFVHGKGNQMRRVGGGASEGNSSGNVVKTPLLQNLQRQNSESAVAGSAMNSMLSNKNDAARAALKEKKAAAKADIDGFGSSNSQMGESQHDVAYQNEWDLVKKKDEVEGSNAIDAKHGLFKTLMLSRTFVFAFFCVDMLLTALTCAISTMDIFMYIYWAVNCFFCLLYMVQFSISLLSFIPKTPDGPLDCTWNGIWDALTALLGVCDVVLLVQTFTANPFFLGSVGIIVSVQASQELLLILAVGMRATRLVRVIFFWNKVSKFHRVRARYWVEYNEEYQTLRRLEASGVDISKMGQTTSNGMGSDPYAGGTTSIAAVAGRGAPPPRPERPAFLNNLGNRASVRKAMSVARRSANPNGGPPIIPPRPNFGAQWGAYQPQANPAFLSAPPTSFLMSAGRPAPPPPPGSGF